MRKPEEYDCDVLPGVVRWKPWERPQRSRRQQKAHDRRCALELHMTVGELNRFRRDMANGEWRAWIRMYGNTRPTGPITDLVTVVNAGEHPIGLPSGNVIDPGGQAELPVVTHA